MRIKLEKPYQNVKGQQVKAGEHDASDLPNGLAQYLLDTEQATLVEGSVPVKRTRADKTLTPADVGVIANTANEDDTSEFDRLSAEYEALYGQPPAWNIKLDTLRARVNEAQENEG